VHDRVAAREHRLRADQRERRGQLRDALVAPCKQRLRRALQALRRGVEPVRRHLAARRAQAGAQPLDAHRALREHVAAGRDRALRERLQPECPLLPLRRRRAQQSRAGVQALFERLDPACPGARDPPAQRLGAAHQLAPVGRGERRRGGRRRRSLVGGEVGDGEVGLVTHAADHRNRRGRHRARDRLVVERPEILDRTATANQQQHLALAPPRGSRQRRDDRCRRVDPLHRRRVDDDRHAGRAPPQRGQHVAQRRRRGRGHHADRARHRRQRPLALRIEQALGLQSRLQLQEALVQVAGTGAAHRLDRQLVVAARLVQGDRGPHLDAIAIARREVHVLRPPAEHDRAHLRRHVLQREVPVAAGGARHVRQFAADPDRRNAALQQPSNHAVQLADCQDFPRQSSVSARGSSIHAPSRRTAFHTPRCRPGTRSASRDAPGRKSQVYDSSDDFRCLARRLPNCAGAAAPRRPLCGALFTDLSTDFAAAGRRGGRPAAELARVREKPRQLRPSLAGRCAAPPRRMTCCP